MHEFAMIQIPLLAPQPRVSPDLSTSPVRGVHDALLDDPRVEPAFGGQAGEPTSSPGRDDTALEDKAGGVQAAEGVDGAGEDVGGDDVAGEGVRVAEEEGEEGGGRRIRAEGGQLHSKQGGRIALTMCARSEKTGPSGGLEDVPQHRSPMDSLGRRAKDVG